MWNVDNASVRAEGLTERVANWNTYADLLHVVSILTVNVTAVTCCWSRVCAAAIANSEWVFDGRALDSFGQVIPRRRRRADSFWAILTTFIASRIYKVIRKNVLVEIPTEISSRASCLATWAARTAHPFVAN
jgi:hypothetical protein